MGLTLHGEMVLQVKMPICQGLEEEVLREWKGIYGHCEEGMRIYDGKGRRRTWMR
jgi:hypothetical protein